MIQNDIEKLSTTTRDLRKFGVVVGGLFLLLGGWFCHRHKAAGPWLLLLGALLVFLGLLVPRRLKGTYVLWMTLAFTLSRVVSTVVLTVFYFLVVTPIALTGRLFGKDFLSEKLDPMARTYWLVRERPTVRSRSDLEEQF